MRCGCPATPSSKSPVCAGRTRRSCSRIDQTYRKSEPCFGAPCKRWVESGERGSSRDWEPRRSSKRSGGRAAGRTDAPNAILHTVSRMQQRAPVNIICKLGQSWASRGTERPCASGLAPHPGDHYPDMETVPHSKVTCLLVLLRLARRAAITAQVHSASTPQLLGSSPFPVGGPFQPGRRCGSMTAVAVAGQCFDHLRPLISPAVASPWRTPSQVAPDTDVTRFGGTSDPILSLQTGQPDAQFGGASGVAVAACGICLYMIPTRMLETSRPHMYDLFQPADLPEHFLLLLTACRPSTVHETCQYFALRRVSYQVECLQSLFWWNAYIDLLL